MQEQSQRHKSMNVNDGTDWAVLDAMSDDEVRANATSDPDCPPDVQGKRIHLRTRDGKNLLERFRKALERDKKVSLTVRYDADVVRWYKAKGKGYQSIMNAALRACMEAEQAGKT